MAGAAMTIYWGSGSPPCWRALIALEEKGLKGYQSKILSFEKKEHKSDEILALNPRGQVPVFTHGNIVINESLAICAYLERTFKNQGTKLIPDDPVEAANVLQRTHEAAINVQKKSAEELLVFLFFRVNELSADTLKERKKALRDELDIWEGYLSKIGKGGHIASKDFTMADTVFFPLLAILVRSGLPVNNWPHLGEYYQRVLTRPSVVATFPPHWKQSEGKPLLTDV